jgi:co-chaperonin GroES (HSP10)
MPKELILVGDRVLVSPEPLDEKTDAGLYLPEGVQEKEQVRTGRVVNVGPGYVMPNPEHDDEPWKPDSEPVRYLPLQAEEGDLAFFVRSKAIEIEYNGEEFLIVPHNSILALVREQLDETEMYDFES